MIPLEHGLLLGASLVVASILSSKITERFGVPALLLFLGIGMLAGSDGPGGIAFTDTQLAQAVGIVALALILFASALQTHAKSMRPILAKGISLATMGVVVSTALVGVFSKRFLSMTWLEGLLLGSIVSSTDAAAVFSVLRSRKISLREPIKPLLELESGSNDPTAVLLTIGFIGLLKSQVSTGGLALLFFIQLAVGAAMGYLAGITLVYVFKKLKLQHEGLYPAFSLAFVLFTYSATAVLKGNGFLAVYMAGLILSEHDFFQKRALTRFHDGLAWLMQIGMFLILGLLVFPSHLPQVFGPGVALALFLVFVARPASVFLSLAATSFSIHEKWMLAWGGLRGAAPIILATFPLVAGITGADNYFNLVFFIVIVSVLLQGPTISWVAQRLGVEVPLQDKPRSPLEFDASEAVEARLEEFVIPFNAVSVGRSLTELDLPAESLITLICREDKYLVPSGRTTLQEGDVLSVLASPDSLREVQAVLCSPKRARS